MRAELKQEIVLFQRELKKFLLTNNLDISTDFLNPTDKKFPHDSCKGASYILGQFLKDEFGISRIYYVFGTNSNGYTHGWLELNDLIIDLTTNQFSDIYPEVMIIEKSKSKLHSTFKNQQSFLHELRRDHLFMEIKNQLTTLVKTNRDLVIGTKNYDASI